MPGGGEGLHLLTLRFGSGRDVAGFLRDIIRLHDAEIAHVTGVHEGSVRRWCSNDPDVGEPRPEGEKKLKRLAAVIYYMLDHLVVDDPQRVGYFLRAIVIDEETGAEISAFDQIAQGDTSPVIERAQATFPPKPEPI